MSDSLRELHRELQTCQRRLGTRAEAPDDFERVLSIAHRINNEIAAHYLRHATAEEARPPRTLASFVREFLRR
jgi:hypothetical protein